MMNEVALLEDASSARNHFLMVVVDLKKLFSPSRDLCSQDNGELTQGNLLYKCIAWKKYLNEGVIQQQMRSRAKAQAIKLIEITLQISNVDLIAAYALKEKFSSAPLLQLYRIKIIDPALSDMQCDKSSILEGSRQVKITAYLEKGEVLSLKVMENFSPSAASRLFEQEIREVILGTFGGLGAAGLSASLLTSILPTTLEDLLALGFCSAGGFLAISNFPARRKDAIEKVRKVADGLSRELEEAMEKDLLQAIERLNSFIKVISQPYQEAAQRRLECLQETQKELSNTAQKLQDLKVQIENLHL
ncbi:hypothetical protein HPP92_011740 [Vanilla planifolia]|uniref:Uncharacterized protein n=1 Tax=Vanilla planifolia TaxID=51239 RepID=A0A835V5B0_VANPL|nr:hypothetical protein HPP92_011740 [Vanilla planifolia]